MASTADWARLAIQQSLLGEVSAALRAVTISRALHPFRGRLGRGPFPGGISLMNE